MTPEVFKEWETFKAALAAWEEVVAYKPVNAQDDYRGNAEFRALRAAAKALHAWAYRKALLPL